MANFRFAQAYRSREFRYGGEPVAAPVHALERLCDRGDARCATRENCCRRSIGVSRFPGHRCLPGTSYIDALLLWARACSFAPVDTLPRSRIGASVAGRHLHHSPQTYLLPREWTPGAFFSRTRHQRMTQTFALAYPALSLLTTTHPRAGTAGLGSFLDNTCDAGRNAAGRERHRSAGAWL